MVTGSELKTAAEEIAAEVVETRRDIHRHPELGYEEQRTSALVAERLRAIGVDEVRTGVGKTGVVGVLRGGSASGESKTVLLRADMDALPIQEATGLPFESSVPGVMHACGHDAHTAILLGTARVLAERRAQLRGSVVFMFQPAEENGGAGAKRMVDDGVLDDPKVDAAFALHGAGRRPVGQAAISPGPSHGSSDRFIITVRGKGGHASAPHSTVDPVVVGAHIVTALQTLVSREVPPAESAVVTVGSITAGTIFNVIPETATLKGTFRAHSESVRTLLRTRIEEVAKGVAAALRATAELEEFGIGYPPVVSDAAMAELAASAAREVLGEAGVVPGQAEMGGEDFSFVLQKVPGAFIRLGTRDPSWETPKPAHAPTFQLSEAALPLGVAVMAMTAVRFLES
jgi:amidohydrolase